MNSPSPALARLACLALPFVLARCACPTPEPPPLRGVDVGTVVGEVFIDVDGERSSIGGANITILGLPVDEISEPDKSFVLESVPLGTHDVTIRQPVLDRAIRFPITLEAPFQTLQLPPEKTTLVRAAIANGTVAVEDPALAKVFLVGGGPDQVVSPGDDGTFSLPGLPAGSAQIAVAADGFDVTVREVALGEGDNDVGEFALAPSSAAGLSLSSSVQIVGETDHRGVTIKLDGGSQVASTAEDGSFTFGNVAPGQHTLTASRPGFLTVELPTVALNASGEVFGVVPMFLTPGEDVVIVENELPDAGPGPEPGDDLFADIESPAAGTVLLEGDQAILQVELTGSVAGDVVDDDIVWSVRAFGTGDPLVEIGRGLVVTTTSLPVGTLDVVVAVTEQSSTLTAADSVTIEVQAVELLPVFSFDVDGGIAPPVITLLADRTEVSLAQTQPATLSISVDHPTEGDIADRAEWVSDTGILIVGADADLSTLPVGTHDFTITVEDLGGRVGTHRVVVTVAPFAFTLTVNAPGLDNTASPPPPYFVEQGLPFGVSIQHSFQTAFVAGAIKWFDIDNAQVAGGPSGRTFALDETDNLIRVEVTDILGNVATASAQFVLQSVDFTVTILAPGEGTDVLEGTPLVGAVDVVHSLVPAQIAAADLDVRWLSSIQGLLSEDGTGATVFGIDDTPTFSTLLPGLHTLTATVSDGSTIATATRQVRVRSPGITATLTAPADGTVFFTGQAVNLASLVTIDPEVAAQLSITWRVDDVEFDAAWDDYGTNDANPGRATINLGNYAPGAGNFADPRLAPGRHDIELLVRLDDGNPTPACVDIAQRSECIRFTIELVDANVDLCPGGTNRTVSAPETWAGVRRLNCILTLASQVTVAPGARIVVDALPGNPNGRSINVAANASFLIGDAAAVEPAVFEVQGALAGLGTWRGIQLLVSTGQAATIVAENVVFRNANAVFDDNDTFDGGLAVLELRGVHAEKVNVLWRDFCPEVVEDITVDNAGVSQSGALITESASDTDCRGARTYRGLTLRNSDRGMLTNQAGTLTIEDGLFEDLRGNGIERQAVSGVTSQDGLLVVTGTTFRRVGRQNNQHAIAERNCGRLRVERSLFEDNLVAVDDNDRSDCEFYTRPERRFDVAGSVFVDNNVAFSLRNRGGGPAPEIHTSTFVGNALDVETLNDGADVNMQGNFVGAAGDFTSAGGVLRALPAGLVANLPRITDVFDAASNEHHVHVDNPLDAAVLDPAATPLVFLRAPAQAERVPVGGCARIVLESPYASPPGDVADVADCVVFVDGAAATVGADGCLTAPVPGVGEHAVVAQCTLDNGIIEEHRGRFLVDAVKRSGTTLPAGDTWSGVVELDGDVTVPFGSTLTILPGTVVKLGTSDRLRGERYPNNLDGAAGEDCGGALCVTDDNTSFGPNITFGDRERIDIFVDGNLQAVGTAALPIRFESVTGISIAQQWGGIRVSKLATARLDHVEIDGATIAVHGELTPNDIFSAPQIEITNSAFTSTEQGIRGVCPTTFADNSMLDVTSPFSIAHCADAFTILRSTFDRIGNAAATNTIAFNFGTFASGGPPTVAVTFDQSTLTRGFGEPGLAALRQRPQSNIGLFVVRDSVIDNYDSVVEFTDIGTSPSYAARLERSLVSNFDAVLNTGSFFPTSLQVVQSELSNGNEIMAFNSQTLELVVADTRVVNVQIPLDDVDIDIVDTIAVTGSQFEGATTVFLLDFSSPGVDSVFAVDLSGNNYLGTVNEVLRFRQGNLFFDGGAQDRNVVALLDFTGSHFGAAVTAPAIEAELLDPQIDASAADTIKGRSDYSGFSTTPLPLNLLP